MPRTLKAPDLLKSWEVVSRYNGIPQNYSDRLDLIRTRYGDRFQGKPLSAMPESQAHNVATSIYNRAFDFINERLTPDEKSLLTPLLAYETTLKTKAASVPLTRRALGIDEIASLNDTLDGLEERIAIQIADCDLPEDSLVIQEYEKLRAEYKRQAN